MDQEKLLSGNSPSIVIAVGEFSSRVASGVEEILRLDVSSAAMQDFLYLGIEDGAVALLDQPSFGESSFDGLTEDAFIDNLPSIQMRLNDVFHSLQAHENLVRSGNKRDVDQHLSIHLLADFSADGGSLFFPLWLLLNQLLSRIPDAKGYILLQIASFEKHDGKRAEFVQIYDHVRCLDDWFGCEDCTERKELARRLGLKDDSLWLWQPFFFDRYKEGVWEAKDCREIQIIMENFLLALLVSKLGDDLCQKSDQIVRLEQKAYYNSASASAMLHDPEALIENCAYRFGAELLVSEFDAALAASDEKVMQQVESVLRELGSLRHWTSEILDGIPVQVNADNFLSFQYTGERTGFEYLPEAEWAYAINADHQHVLEYLVPAFLQKIASKGLRLSMDFPEKLTTYYYALIENPDFYPGAIANLKRLGGELRQNFLDRVADVDQAGLDLEDEATLNKKLESELEKIDDLVALLPTLPAWFKWLPKPLKELGENVFRFLFYREEYQSLLEKRNESLFISNAIIENRIAQEAAGQLIAIAGCLCDPLDEIAPKVDRFSSVIASVKLHFEQKAHKFEEENFDFFRVPLLSAELISDIYDANQPAFALSRMSLLQAGFFSEWELISDQILAERLYEFSREKFSHFSNIDLDKLLLQHDQLSPQKIADLFTQGMLPLLRVSFDHIGVGHSTLMNFLIAVNAKDSPVYHLLGKDELFWQSLESSHPASMIAVQVRRAIPLSAMVSIADLGRNVDSFHEREN